MSKYLAFIENKNRNTAYDRIGIYMIIINSKGNI